MVFEKFDGLHSVGELLASSRAKVVQCLWDNRRGEGGEPGQPFRLVSPSYASFLHHQHCRSNHTAQQRNALADRLHASPVRVVAVD